MPNGRQAPIRHVGSIVFNSGLELKDVIHILDFQFNLLSISKLTRQYSTNVVFTPDLCLLQGHTMQRAVALGKQSKGLYCMNKDLVQRRLYAA